MPNINIFPDVNRAKLSIVKDWIHEKLGIDPESVIVNTDILRISAKFDEKRGEIEIPVKTNDNDYPLDKKLSNDDIFFITDLLAVVSKESDTEGGNSILLPYPDPVLFDNVGEAAALMCYFNGKLALEDNHNKRFYNYPMIECLKVPMRQMEIDGTGRIVSYPSIDLRKSAIAWNPFEVVSGLANSRFKIQYNGKYDAISDSGKNRATILAFGFKGAGLASAFSKYEQSMKR